MIEHSEWSSHKATIVLRNVEMLCGHEMLVKRGSIVLQGGLISDIIIHEASESCDVTDAMVMDGSDLIVIPSFCNAHVHVLDGNEKERWIGYTIPQLFSEGCLKEQWLSKRSDQEKIQAARGGLEYMFRCGSTATVIYIEEGIAGVRLVKEAAESLPIDAKFLGHPLDPSQFTVDEVQELLKESDGVALCSLNVTPTQDVDMLHDETIRAGKIVTTHMAEIKPTSNFEKAIDHYRPHFLVHGNYFSDEQLSVLAQKGIGLVCCIRPGRTFLADTPDLVKLEKLGIKYAFGTDNLFTNTPDMFRELEFITRDLIIRHRGHLPIPAERILRAATFDGFEMGHMERRGLLSKGFHADFIILKKDSNLTPFHGAISILLRAAPHHIRYVVKDGRFFSV
eukprot:TRINITY_DN2655_c1_g1_i1.p1 TRINITY_DN2655_c1_g1~~TRINITY_DN2655_c1_g1_i1.p1  ORF type:complete len:394 (+),score=77.71 TRINITY_DN2655_c1_g1_i1:44-1225(+)